MAYIKRFYTKKILLLAILFVFLGLLSLVLFKRNFPISSSTNGNSFVVEITASGFSPEMVKIRLGDRIRWVNKDTNDHLPASDPHPTHEFLEAFEPLQALTQGVSWEFTFNEAGEWLYHDHLFPHRRGIIIVESKSNQKIFSKLTFWLKGIFQDAALSPGEIPPELKELLNEKDTKRQAKIVRAMAERYGPKQALEVMKRSGLPYTGETHLLVHAIGDVAYERYGDGALKVCDESFLSACFHGVIIHALGKEGMGGVSRMVKQCKDSGPLVFTQCSHAAGHGFLAWKNYEILEGLGLCDRLGELDNAIPLFSCYDGVFMENIFGVHDGVPSPNRMVKEGDPYYPCNAVPQKYRKGCWANQATLMYQQFKGNLREVAKHCDAVAEKEYKETCYHNFARQIHPLTLGKSEHAINLCKNASGEWQDFCLFTIVEAAFSVGDRTNMPYEICAYLKDKPKQTCYEKLFNLLQFHKSAGSITGNYCVYVKEAGWYKSCAKKMGLADDGLYLFSEDIGDAKRDIERIKYIVRHNGAAAAYMYLQNKALANPSAEVHDLAHLVGRLAYEELKETGLKVCTSDFAFGCYHGFFEELIRKQKEKAILFAVSGCHSLSFPGQTASCIHGIGHGVFVWKGDVSRALFECDALASKDQLYCFDGVFMEYFANPMNLKFASNKSWNQCSGFDKRYQSQCVRNHILFLLHTEKSEDYASVAKECETIGDSENRSQCVLTSGLFASQRSQGSIQFVEKICNIFADEERAACLIASVQEFIFQRKYPKNAHKICEAVIQQNWKEPCFQSIFTMHSLYGE